MNPGVLLVELAEKTGLIASAALLAVLFPPVRKRLLGIGGRKDKLAAMVMAIGLSVWGTMLGLTVLGEPINVRAIGILIGAILGGLRVGALTGLIAGAVYALRVDPAHAPWVVLGSVIDGALAGWVAQKFPRSFEGIRTFFTCTAIQAIHLAIIGGSIAILEDPSVHIAAWPAHLMKILVNSLGVTLFVMVAHVIIGREEHAVALIKAEAEADASALDALRRRLEPHFLFNTLNTLRATIRKDPDQARDLVSDLADLYRYLLSHPKDATLKEEADHAQAYLAIEGARLGPDRLAVENEITADLEHVIVPALLLQPLVENAVHHGVGAHDGPGRIVLRATRSGDDLVIEVENHHTGVYKGSFEGTGTALATLRDRLARQYGPGSTIELETRDDGATATVTIPANLSAI